MGTANPPVGSSGECRSVSARPPRPRASVEVTSRCPKSTGLAEEKISWSETAASEVSTAPGSRGNSSAGSNTPCSGQVLQQVPSQQLTYTTLDGQQLEIQDEEELDLAAILNA